MNEYEAKIVDAQKSYRKSLDGEGRRTQPKAVPIIYGTPTTEEPW